MKVAQNKRFRFGHLRCRSPHGERGLKFQSQVSLENQRLSLPARGAWIEIAARAATSAPGPGRSPHGERGLKFLRLDEDGRVGRRSPHGERGLKYGSVLLAPVIERGRSPHGERGLKFGSVAGSVGAGFRRSPHGERGLKFGSVAGSVGAGFRRSPHGERGLKCKISGSGKQYEAVAPRTGSVG